MMDNTYAQKWAAKPHGGFSKTISQSAAATTGNIATVKTSTLRFNVQEIIVTVLTGSSGKTWTLADSSGTVALTPALDMSTAGVEHKYDFGEVGVPLTLGEAIRNTISGAGAAGKIVIRGYWSE